MKNCWQEAAFMQSCGIHSRALKITGIPKGYTWMAILPEQKAKIEERMVRPDEKTERIYGYGKADRPCEAPCGIYGSGGGHGAGRPFVRIVHHDLWRLRRAWAARF